MRNYTDKELLDEAKKTHGFVGFPTGYWLLGVRSVEDKADEYDDKFYLFVGEKFVMVTTGTTNAGREGLLNFVKYNSAGCAVVKSGEWYYDLWATGQLHKGKMKCLKQLRNILFFRDSNKNLKAEETGKVYFENIGINFHTRTYETNPSIFSKLKKSFIGGWSVGCQVVDDVVAFYKIIELTMKQGKVSYCLIKSF